MPRFNDGLPNLNLGETHHLPFATWAKYARFKWKEEIMSDYKTYFEDDADLSLLENRPIAILGYGAQGRAHALNARDSGCPVIVGQRRGGPNYQLAVDDGFHPVSLAEATARSKVINVLLPDEKHGPLFKSEIEPHLKNGDVLMACHGFSLHYREMIPPPGTSAILVAPKGAGHMVRTAYTQGHGVACLIAPGEHADQQTFDTGLAYAKAIGGTRAGVMETTIAAETETDLFGEQVVLCGGVSHLVKMAFDVLVEAGYQKELAFFECLHELKLVVDLLHQGGLAFMHEHISNTAEFGDFSRGHRIVDDQTKSKMETILKEIQSGEFAKEWLAEYKEGCPRLDAFRQEEKESEIEAVGNRLRNMMNSGGQNAQTNSD